VALYILDMLQILDYKQILSKIPGFKQVYAAKIEDRYLLERVELDKKWQILDEKIRNYEQDKAKLDADQRDVAIARDNIEKDKENVQNMIDNFEKAKAEKEAYDKRVDEVAAQIENMPPKSAVLILEKEDDMMIIDIMKRMEARAADASRQSSVPYLLSLMDPEQAARIHRKMLGQNE
jgi:seryl-tRNA synthetase